MVEIWREVIKSSDAKEVTRKTFRLSVIIPIILYIGKDNWTTQLKFKRMLNQAVLFGDNVLNCKYLFLGRTL
ncbi:Rpn family recombination-promoting nuclease/putative transposase [Oceanobacillus sp. FSL W7-1309]|uniref:Rpn family recombination-promoting nuclease/putative transposase n=1 Tax=Oceanobacillus sp. FSL W7-1309 TaxID=2954539 RepID=UPI0030F5CCFF